MKKILPDLCSRGKRLPPRFGFRKNILLWILCLGALATTAAGQSVSVRWAATVKGTPNASSPAAVAADSVGNVYVAGLFTPPGSDAHSESLTIKLDNSGNVLWKAWLGTAGHYASASAIALDGAGNVYVAARYALNGQGQNELVTLKYNTNGVRQWANYIAPAPGGENFPVKLLVTPTGDAYVAATAQLPNFQGQALLVKYNANGQLLWLRRNPMPVAGSNSAAGLGLDASENVYLAVNSTHFYPTVYKFDRNGNALGSFDSPAFFGTFDEFTLDALGNSYAAKSFTPGPMVGAFDPQGNQTWLDHLNPTRRFSDISLDSQGNVLLAEVPSSHGGTASNIGVLKFSAAGNLLFEKQFNSQSDGSGTDFATAITTDPQNNIYLLGSSGAPQNAQPQSDLVTIKYDSNGAQLWLARSSSATRIEMLARAIFLKPDGDIVVAGERLDLTGAPGATNDWVIIEYSQSTP